MIVRSRAPLRISFAGGGTDIPPYSTRYGGCVISTTIDKYTYASLEPREDDWIEIHSLDFGRVVRYRLDDPPEYDGNLDLVKAIVSHLSDHIPGGFTLYLHSDAPPGSGLGASSALVVAVLGAFRRWLHLPWTRYDLAQHAFDIERVEFGIKGGYQDQYAAAFGGFNFIEFLADTVVVNPLRLDPEVLLELEYSLLLCYTGQARRSDGIIEDVVRNYQQRKQTTLDALHGLKNLAIAAKNALLQGRLQDFGELLHQGWLAKKQTARKISTPHIDEMYDAARKAGALGGKLLGAGGGGYLLVYTPFHCRHLVAESLERLGGQLVSFAFEPQGQVAWQAGDTVPTPARIQA